MNALRSPNSADASACTTEVNVSSAEGPSCCERLINIVSMVALTIFYAFSFWCSPYLFTISFFVGIFYSAEIKERISEVFDQMAWKWVIPTAGLLYWFALPATLTMQAVLAGLDMGARWSLAARGLLQENGGQIILCFRV